MNKKPPESNVRKADNPCFGCVPPKRHPGCHDHCPERTEFVRKNAEIKAQREAYLKGLSIRKKW